MNFIYGESVWLNSDTKIRIIHTTYSTFWLSIWTWHILCLFRNVLMLGLVDRIS